MHILQTMSRTKALEWVSITALVMASFLPFLLSQGTANAAQITAREVTIDDSSTSATDVEYLFSYSLPTSADLEGITYDFCTTAQGACTLPTGMDIQTSLVHDAQTGFPTNGTAFAVEAADLGECTAATNSYEICFKRTNDADPGSGAVTHTISGIVNPSVNDSIFVRITTYPNATFTASSATDTGTVAAATVNELTLTAIVEETLEFCVGDTDAASANDCTDISGTTVDLDVLDTSTVNKSSVVGASGDKNGYVMMRANASNGVDIDYSGNTLTSGSDTIAAETTAGGASLSAGTEGWGMEVDTGAPDTSNGTTSNLSENANFTTDNQVYWGSTSPTDFDDIASSTSVLDDEMLVLDFQATAGIATATGNYVTTIMFVGTPNY